MEKLNNKDLRIGNWILASWRSDEDPVPTEVDNIEEWEDGINTYVDYEGGRSYMYNLAPIPLTEEILLKCGFEKINHIHGYSFYSFKRVGHRKNAFNIPIDIYDTRTTYYGYTVAHCEYVHQLQNLFYVLTGKELEIKL